MTYIDSFLKKVIAEKRLEVESRRRLVPESTLRELASCRLPARAFATNLRSGKTIAVIAELKQAAPSGGRLRENYDVVRIARGYAASGACAFSVLTDERYFLGKLEHLDTVSQMNLLPVLRKDFIIDPYQVLESRAFGADAVLLIAAAVTLQQLADLAAVTEALGMQALVEIHDENDLEAALAVGAHLVGINNRNLDTLHTSLAVAERLVPRDRIVVGESGIRSRADLTRLPACGIHAVLIGSHLLRQSEPGLALVEFVGVPRQ